MVRVRFLSAGAKTFSCEFCTMLCCLTVCVQCYMQKALSTRIDIKLYLSQLYSIKFVKLKDECENINRWKIRLSTLSWGSCRIHKQIFWTDWQWHCADLRHRIEVKNVTQFAVTTSFNSHPPTDWLLHYSYSIGRPVALQKCLLLGDLSTFVKDLLKIFVNHQ